MAIIESEEKVVEPSVAVTDQREAVQNVDTQKLDDADAAEFSKEYDKYDKPMAAAALGTLRGIIPGADLIWTKLGADPETIRKIKETSPIISGGTEVAGMIATLPVGGTVGGTTLAAEKFLAKKLAGKIATNEAEKRIVKKIINESLTHGLSAGTGGAGLGINDALNEAALGEIDLNAENLLAYAGMGAAMNGLVGGAFGAVSATVPRLKLAVDDISGQVKKTFNKEMDVARSFSELATDTPKGSTKVYEKLSKDGWTEPEIKNLYVNELGGNIKQTADELVNNLDSAIENSSKKLSQIYKTADSSNINLKAYDVKRKFDQALQLFENANKADLDKTANRRVFEREKRDIENWFDRVTNKRVENRVVDGKPTKVIVRDNPDVKITDLWDQKRMFGNNKKSFGAGPDNFQRQVLQDMYFTAADIIENRIKESSPELFSMLKNQNRTHSLLSVIEQHSRNLGAKKSNFLDFRDFLLGATGALSGMGDIAAAAVAARKIMESDIRRKAVVLGSIQNAKKAVETRVKNVVSSFSKPSQKSIDKAKIVSRKVFQESGLAFGYQLGFKPEKPKDEKEAFKNIQKNLTTYITEPDKLAQRIAMNTMSTANAAPQTAAYIQQTMSKGVQFLYSKMPSNPASEMDIFGKEWEPSTVELAKFQRYVQAVENPMSVMDEVENGTATREHMEALSEVYPALYAKLQVETINSIKEGSKIPYNKKVQLGSLLGIPTDSSLMPVQVLNLQKNFSIDKQQEPGAVKPTVGGMQEVNSAKRMATDTQKHGQES